MGDIEIKIRSATDLVVFCFVNFILFYIAAIASLKQWYFILFLEFNTFLTPENFDGLEETAYRWGNGEKILSSRFFTIVAFFCMDVPPVFPGAHPGHFKIEVPVPVQAGPGRNRFYGY